jgi:hypothetical protein
VAQFFDFDPMTGIRTDFEYDEETGNATLIQSSDVQAAIDYAKTLANTGATDKGIKGGLWKYAVIPPIVQIALRQKGLDIYSKDTTMINRVLREIDEHYPYLKTTTKTHRVKNIRHE